MEAQQHQEHWIMFVMIFCMYNTLNLGYAAAQKAVEDTIKVGMFDESLAWQIGKQQIVSG